MYLPSIAYTLPWMHWFLALIVAPFWGMLSVQFFLQGCVSIIGFCIGSIGERKGLVPPQTNRMAMLAGALGAAVAFGLLATIFYLLVEFLGFGQSVQEKMMYFIFCVVAVVYMVPRLARNVRQQWRNATVPGAFEAYMSDKR